MGLKCLHREYTCRLIPDAAISTKFVQFMSSLPRQIHKGDGSPGNVAIVPKASDLDHRVRMSVPIRKHQGKAGSSTATIT